MSPERIYVISFPKSGRTWRSIEKAVQESIEFSGFSNMRKIEQQSKFGRKLSPKDQNDPESFKVRKGKVDFFWKEMSKEDIEYVNDVLKIKLTESFDRYR